MYCHLFCMYRPCGLVSKNVCSISKGFSHSTRHKISIDSHWNGNLEAGALHLPPQPPLRCFPPYILSLIVWGIESLPDEMKERLDTVRFNGVTKWITTLPSIHHDQKGDHKWSVNHYILITRVLQVSDLMFKRAPWTAAALTLLW